MNVIESKACQLNFSTAIIGIGGLCLALLVPVNANAQSFSCARAQIPSELAICNNEDLLILDEKLSSLFADVRVTTANRAEVQQITNVQRSWLRQRNACALDFDCLQKQYQTRISDLIKEHNPGVSITRSAQAGARQ